MSFNDACMTLYRFKNVDNSGVPMRTADDAREVLRSHFATARGWVQADLRTDDHRRRFMGDLVRVPAGGEPVPLDIPHGEWREFWNDEHGDAVGVTSHYYGLGNRELRELLEFAGTYNLDLQFRGHGSWKNAGHAVIVVMSRK